MPRKKAKAGEETWEDWGERLGEKIEAGFASPRKVRHRLSTGVLLFGSFILLWGVIWLGNDLGWWQITFPFWPIVVILISVGILLSAIRKIF